MASETKNGGNRNEKRTRSGMRGEEREEKRMRMREEEREGKRREERGKEERAAIILMLISCSFFLKFLTPVSQRQTAPCALQ